MIYIGSSNQNPITSVIWERERFEENFTFDMKLIGVLLLSALLISHLAADQLALNSTRMDQNLEKRSLKGKGDCPGGFVYFGYCYKFVPIEKTWIEAELHCQDLAPGGHLASLHWMEQYNVLAEMIHNSQNNYVPAWIGLSDIHKEGTFLWSDGSASDFMFWAKGEPNDNGGREECVQILFKKTHWNDLSCNSKLCFLCSYKLPPPSCK
ncbi:lectin-like [Chiloscyllium plagiosum]|uniref:lectin-like n=1 Tax=Chiloscyllium plagiosum TaxID=36176 RepID=UPI001CB85727|nr:lectin-like [Chiloscyllium plagiosum]